MRTPGQNKKHDLAGALNAASRKLTWVDGKSKSSALFIKLLWRLLAGQPAFVLYREDLGIYFRGSVFASEALRAEAIEACKNLNPSSESCGRRLAQ